MKFHDRETAQTWVEMELEDMGYDADDLVEDIHYEIQKEGEMFTGYALIEPKEIQAAA